MLLKALDRATGSARSPSLRRRRRQARPDAVTPRRAEPRLARATRRGPVPLPPRKARPPLPLPAPALPPPQQLVRTRLPRVPQKAPPTFLATRVRAGAAAEAGDAAAAAKGEEGSRGEVVGLAVERVDTAAVREEVVDVGSVKPSLAPA